MEDECQIREKFNNSPTLPDDDINTSVDQTKKLIIAIKNGLEYPSSKNGFKYDDIIGFFNQLSQIFDWSIYEKSTLGNESKRKWYAVILSQWMEGSGLSYIMQRAIDYHKQHPENFRVSAYQPPTIYNDNSKEHRNVVFADTLEAIENIVLFSISNYFLRFSNEYKKIHGVDEFDNNWYEYVEFGTTNPLTILLQRNGFSRESATFIKKHKNEYVVHDGSTDELRLRLSLLNCGNTSVMTEGEIVYQDTDLTEDLATICFSHNESYTYLLQMETFRVCGQDEYLCIPFVATVLRLADIIDFDPKRTPSVLFSHLAVKNPVSLSEWKKHQSINAWTISPRKLLFSAQCEHPAIEATILAFCNQIDEELRNGTVILSNLSDEGMDIDVEVYKISLPPQVDRRKIQAKKDIISGKPIYRYHDTKFSLSKKQIIDLLMGTKLYGKPGVALRELLQNSIDACLLRQKLSELWGIEYTPKVKVSLYTKNNVDYLRVSDNGVGMNQHIIDNYYTNVGCSYYSSREFSELMVSFKSSFTPISRFGIGILSCFMVCDSMEVTTRRIRERFECDEALHISIEGYESLFVISDSNKKEPGTDTILTLRPVHPWDRMNEEEFMQCIKGIVPNPAVQIEIETNKGSELYSSDYFDDLDLKPLLDYSWNNIKNIRKIDIDLTCEAYGFKGKGCIGILIKNGLPAEEIEILSKDVEIDGEIYTLSSNIKYKTNCITETSTSISVDEDGEIDTNTSWSERFKSKASLSIHGIEVPYNLFPDYSNGMSKAALKIPFPFSFRLDIGVNSDLNLNSARDQIIYDEKWLTFEENLYRIICRRLKDTLSSSDWKILNEIIQKNNTDTFSRVANSFE